MKYFLLYALVEVVADRSDKHALCQCRYFACRDKTIHLGVERMAHVLTVDGDRLTFLEHFAEAFG